MGGNLAAGVSRVLATSTGLTVPVGVAGTRSPSERLINQRLEAFIFWVMGQFSMTYDNVAAGVASMRTTTSTADRGQPAASGCAATYLT